MALYRPDTDGNFNSDENNLIERWISGADGRFTEEDRYQDRIPEGFGVGDLKPHRISRIPDGPYYIVEEEVPAYMVKREPMKVRLEGYSQDNRMVNLPLKGRLELVKKRMIRGNAGECQISNYKQRYEGGMVHNKTGHDGRAKLQNLAVGKFGPMERLIPIRTLSRKYLRLIITSFPVAKSFFTFDGSREPGLLLYM